VQHVRKQNVFFALARDSLSEAGVAESDGRNRAETRGSGGGRGLTKLEADFAVEARRRSGSAYRRTNSGAA